MDKLIYMPMQDLEIAADFDVVGNHNEIMHNLLASDHVQVSR